MKRAKTLLSLAVLSLLAACTAHSISSTGASAPLQIQAQGSFAAGGTVTTAPGTFDPRKPMVADGQTYHGDHAYVFYQVPNSAKSRMLKGLPLRSRLTRRITS
ncbi:exported protein [Pseudomonas fragi]|uniref:Exported protein n=1 Tax=Pseudomonas fragi TaxID=296 RepID=A0A449IFP5_PSEFR|nr:exported protein [Pseudomonas fragi]